MEHTAQTANQSPENSQQVLIAAAYRLGAYQRNTLSAQRDLDAAASAIAGCQEELATANAVVAEKEAKLNVAKRAQAMARLEVENAYAVVYELHPTLHRKRRELFAACAFGNEDDITAAVQPYGEVCKAYGGARDAMAQAHSRETSARHEVLHREEVTDLAKVERSRIEERLKRYLAWHMEALARMPISNDELLRLQKDLSNAVQRMAETGYIDTFNVELTQALPIVPPEGF